MLQHCLGRWILVFAVCFLAPAVVYPQQKDHDSDRGSSDEDTSVDENNSPADFATLVETLDRGGPDAVWALQQMRRLGVSAAPAVGRLCEKLGDANQTLRRVAIEVLESIGNDSIAPLRQVMQDESGRKRAAAVNALLRLNGIEFEDFEPLIRDPDLRVRATAARGLASFGKQGVPLLITLLSDQELPVAFEAATWLETNVEDPGLAIPALTRALSRPHLAFGAATALGAYARDSKRSIPWIIAALPLDSSGEFDDQQIEILLEEVGPPDPADLQILIASLKLKEPLARKFAASSLGQLRKHASEAAEALEAAAISTLKEGATIDSSPHEGRREWFWEAHPYWSAANECLSAFWKVTRDPARVIKLFETCVTIAGKDVYFEATNDFPQDYLKFVVNPLTKDSQPVRDDRIPESRFDQSEWADNGWSESMMFVDLKGYAERPPKEKLTQVKVLWNPPKIDRLGNVCKFGGQLVVAAEGSNALVPVNWFQGVGFCLAKIPEAHPDWTIDVDRRDTTFGTSVATREGRFEFSVELKKLKTRRDIAQSFQGGIILSSFKDQANSVTLIWSKQHEVLPSSVAMLTIPQAPAIAHELEFLNRASGWPRKDSNTVDVINAVNALHRLGRQESLESLQRFVELDYRTNDYDRQSLFWIIALLFEPVLPDEPLPTPNIAFLQSTDDDQGEWPLEVVDGIPFVMPGRSDPENCDRPDTMIAWAWRHGVLREKPLVPKSNPVEAAEVVLRSRRIQAYTMQDKYQASLYSMVREQAIRMTDGLIEPLPKPRGMGGYKPPEDEFLEFFQWHFRRIEAGIKQIDWSVDQQRFVGIDFN